MSLSFTSSTRCSISMAVSCGCDSKNLSAECMLVKWRCGYYSTMKFLAAPAIYRQAIHDVKYRLLKEMGLFKLVPRTKHPYAMKDPAFAALFTPAKPVI